MSDLAAVTDDPWAPEALDPELEAHLEVGEREGWLMLRHPLVYAVPYFPAENKRLNKLLHMKRSTIARGVEREEWSSVIFLHERPYRLAALMEHRGLMTHRAYWEMVRDVWVDSENIRQSRSEWRKLLTSPRPGRWHCAMTDEDRAMLAAAFPDSGGTVRIWRGHGPMEGGRRMGLSWSLDREKAAWFARRNSRLHGHPAILSEARVLAADILLAIATRNESEVVVLPSALLGVRRVPLVAPTTEQTTHAASAAGATTDE